MVVFLPKSIEILAHKGSQTIGATPRDNLAPWNRKPTGQRDLLASMTMDQRFPGKVTHCRNVFISRSLRGALRRTTQYWARLPKPKAKPAGKKWKNRKMCWGARQRIDRQLSKLRLEAIVNVYVSRLVLVWRKENLIFNIIYGKFWPATSSVEILTPARSSASTSRFHKGIVFSSWQNGTLSFFFRPVFFFSLYHFFYSYKGLSPALYFSTSNDLSISKQLPRVCILRDVNKIWK